MVKALLTKEESALIAEDVLHHCYGDNKFAVNQDMVDRVAIIILGSLEKIMEKRNKPIDPYPYLITEDELRAIFEEQHHGRALTRSHRGTYQSVQIAAIWNQHVRTARAIEKILTEKFNCSANRHG